MKMIGMACAGMMTMVVEGYEEMSPFMHVSAKFVRPCSKAVWLHVSLACRSPSTTG